MDMSLSKLWKMAKDSEGWHAAVHGVAKNRTWLSDWTTTAVHKRIVHLQYHLWESQRNASLFISKASHSVSQWSKSMPQPVTLKKLKLNGFMKTYKTFRTNTQKRCPFHSRGLECKSRKSRNTWSNRKIWPWSMEWSRAKANRILPRKCTGHSKHPLPTTQEKTLHMDITRWSTPKSDWL